ncbi:MAG: flagellin domain protein, partial [Vampirovibrio sp.]|nr:flagellin domain protein [Vampirovibrio sp.]
LAVDTETMDTHANAQAAIAALDTAIDTVNTARGNLGASSNRLESNAANLSTNIENLSSSESRIRNVDVAQESATLSRNQILQQAASAMLAQANQSPQLALQLLRG